MKISSLSVVAIYPGANTTDIEQLVGRPLEDDSKELDDIDKIRTTAKDGVAFIGATFFAVLIQITNTATFFSN